MNQKIWLVGVMGANLLGFVSSFLQVSGDGLSVQASTIGLASIVVLHFVLLGFFVFEDFAEQRREVLGLKRLVAAEAKQLHERQVAIAVVSSQLDRERATQRRLVSERDEAQARLETVTKNLRGAFEQMIETKRFATLGGFWPQFSGALSSGMDRLIHLRRELAPSLERLDQLELVEKMDTALSSCREMADAVEGALEFDGKRSAELDRVVPMAVTLLGWSSDEPTLQIRMEKGLEVPGAQAEWLQVVMNLLANARDAIGGDEGQNAGARVVFQASRLEMGVQIVVEDSGPGWPAELLRVRLTDLLEEPQQRTGLGLAICAAICKRYEATMTLHKSALGGASVTIQAPLPGET
jgi:signal transduction histidine kinase